MSPLILKRTRIQFKAKRLPTKKFYRNDTTQMVLKGILATEKEEEKKRSKALQNHR